MDCRVRRARIADSKRRPQCGRLLRQMVKAAGLMGLGRLVRGADLFSRLLQDARNFVGEVAVGSQIKILLIGCGAIGRQNDAAWSWDRR